MKSRKAKTNFFIPFFELKISLLTEIQEAKRDEDKVKQCFKIILLQS